MEGLSEAKQPRYVLTSDFKKLRLIDLKAAKAMMSPSPYVSELGMAHLPRVTRS